MDVKPFLYNLKKLEPLRTLLKKPLVLSMNSIKNVTLPLL